ncbi:hypothetical protein [Mesorhizobium sp. CA16]|uniref:hypothetical protein n=1 Tax=Mesorhizobium sp. CA16 TaxID=588496 RepID=UPI001CCB0168|nr:hypothetical protein [Mesorhizobium sp. CA16]MBZ9910711.1 hypothetical protein [Mesorhizobium sp. CA16]
MKATHFSYLEISLGWTISQFCAATSRLFGESSAGEVPDCFLRQGQKARISGLLKKADAPDSTEFCSVQHE